MIVNEVNNKKEERIKMKKIFEMLRDVKLPKKYEFVADCVELRRKGFFGYKVADLDLLQDDIINVVFVEEKDFINFKRIFENSKTKFRYVLSQDYY